MQDRGMPRGVGSTTFIICILGTELQVAVDTQFDEGRINAHSNRF